MKSRRARRCNSDLRERNNLSWSGTLYAATLRTIVASENFYKSNSPCPSTATTCLTRSRPGVSSIRSGPRGCRGASRINTTASNSSPRRPVMKGIGPSQWLSSNPAFDDSPPDFWLYAPRVTPGCSANLPQTHLVATGEATGAAPHATVYDRRRSGVMMRGDSGGHGPGA